LELIDELKAEFERHKILMRQFSQKVCQAELRQITANESLSAATKAFDNHLKASGISVEILSAYREFCASLEVDHEAETRLGDCNMSHEGSYIHFDYPLFPLLHRAISEGDLHIRNCKYKALVVQRVDDLFLPKYLAEFYPLKLPALPSHGKTWARSWGMKYARRINISP